MLFTGKWPFVRIGAGRAASRDRWLVSGSQAPAVSVRTPRRQCQTRTVLRTSAPTRSSGRGLSAQLGRTKDGLRPRQFAGCPAIDPARERSAVSSIGHRSPGHRILRLRFIPGPTVPSQSDGSGQEDASGLPGNPPPGMPLVEPTLGASVTIPAAVVPGRNPAFCSTPRPRWPWILATGHGRAGPGPVPSAPLPAPSAPCPCTPPVGP